VAKQVTLIGDSIRMGYEPTVKQLLAGVADVWGPEENGSHTVNVLVKLSTWVLNRRPDIVHINCGLHDLKTIWYGGRSAVVPLDHYRENVQTILETIQRRTSAKIIWATTTPVHDQRAHAAHAQANDFDRFDSFVRKYNEAAVEVCQVLDVPVNDLYALVYRAGREQYLRDDGVHFTPEGYKLLGEAVAESIRKLL